MLHLSINTWLTRFSLQLNINGCNRIINESPKYLLLLNIEYSAINFPIDIFSPNQGKLIKYRISLFYSVCLANKYNFLLTFQIASVFNSEDIIIFILIYFLNKG